MAKEFMGKDLTGPQEDENDGLNVPDDFDQQKNIDDMFGTVTVNLKGLNDDEDEEENDDEDEDVRAGEEKSRSSEDDEDRQDDEDSSGDDDDSSSDDDDDDSGEESDEDDEEELGEEDDDELDEDDEDEEEDELPDVTNLEIAALKKQIELLQAETEAAKQQAIEAAKTSKEEEKKEEFKANLSELPDLGLKLSPQVIEKLNDPEQFPQAVELMLNTWTGVAMQKLKHEIMTDLLPQFANEQIPRAITPVIAQMSSREQMRKDYFGAYPKHDDPDIWNKVDSAAAMLHEQAKASGISDVKWTPKFRDQIAALVKAQTGVDGKADSVKPRGKRKVREQDASKKKSARSTKKSRRRKKTPPGVSKPTSRKGSNKGSSQTQSVAEEMDGMY